MKKPILLTLAVLALFLIPIFSTGQASIAGYTLQTIEGRYVYVENTALANHSARTQQALALLKRKLQEIDKMNMTFIAKNHLKSVRFFVDWNIDPSKAAVYHPYRQWLINNGWNVEKLRSVNIVSVNNFIDWTALNQPYMILHELSHSYHDLVLGYSNPDVLNTYRSAIASGKYNSVPYFNGRDKKSRKKAYATGDEKEYFAEITEAYFGQNDYYPFDRGDLGIHDPKAYTLLRKVWQNSVYNPNAVFFNSNKYYRLTTMFRGSGMSLDVVNDGTNNKLQLAPSGNYTGQSWRIEKLSDGYYRLTTEFQGKGKSLDVVNDGVNNKLQLAPSGNYTGQSWRIESLGNGYYRLTSEFQGEGKSLDVVNDGTNNKIQLSITGNYSGQYWKITEFK